MMWQVSLDTLSLGMQMWFAYLVWRPVHTHACQRTGGMVYLTKPLWMGVAWIYGAITMVCF